MKNNVIIDNKPHRVSDKLRPPGYLGYTTVYGPPYGFTSTQILSFFKGFTTVLQPYLVFIRLDFSVILGLKHR